MILGHTRKQNGWFFRNQHSGKTAIPLDITISFIRFLFIRYDQTHFKMLIASSIMSLLFILNINMQLLFILNKAEGILKVLIKYIVYFAL